MSSCCVSDAAPDQVGLPIAEAGADAGAAERRLRAAVPEVVAAAGGDDGEGYADAASPDAARLRQSMWALASEQAAVRRRVEAMERSLDRLGAHKEAAE